MYIKTALISLLIGTGLGALLCKQYYIPCKAMPVNVTSIDWPEEMPIATNGDKFTAELKDGVLYVGFDNSIKETFKR